MGSIIVTEIFLARRSSFVFCRSYSFEPKSIGVVALK